MIIIDASDRALRPEGGSTCVFGGWSGVLRFLLSDTLSLSLFAYDTHKVTNTHTHTHTHLHLRTHRALKKVIVIDLARDLIGVLLLDRLLAKV